ncbi:helix-turn-helix protein [Salegentibacter sp. 24]|jgi:ribosome-binding protein aMBF1 (putative translation factor)|uniref:helix-turn-helix domain-containing protein n=1 Tax=Salegentibacter sp. 24 TaxID=2183986 RepID=UPI00105E2DF3|nr:helix-turn-helix domain-containing protein [Salegentibacter sp. 24]TDN94959.1 helix-turn-helix protein [Salegentibacter sp. 24]
MKVYSREELDLLAIQVGCILRLNRLRLNLSQEDLAQQLGINSTKIGRIERAEHICAWNQLLQLWQKLGIDNSKLFLLKEKSQLLSIISQSYKLEKRLNQDKKDYYSFLTKIVETKYKDL